MKQIVFDYEIPKPLSVAIQDLSIANSFEFCLLKGFDKNFARFFNSSSVYPLFILNILTVPKGLSCISCTFLDMEKSHKPSFLSNLCSED